MTERGIPMKPWEVCAILAGRKTMMRRIIKPQPIMRGPNDCVIHYERGGHTYSGPPDFLIRDILPKYGLRWRPGDTLWVRVTWTPNALTYGRTALYKADGHIVANDDDSDRSPWRSSTQMPRWASRIALRVTGVRVERLQDITETDAIAEGIQWQDPTEEDKQWWADRCAESGDDPELDPIPGVWIAPGTRRGYGATKEQRAEPHWGSSAKEAFRWTWEAIHGEGAWEKNLWVAVTQFERIDPCPKTP